LTVAIACDNREFISDSMPPISDAVLLHHRGLIEQYMLAHVGFGDVIKPLATARLDLPLTGYAFHPPGPSIFAGFAGIAALLTPTGAPPAWVAFLDVRGRGLTEDMLNPLNNPLLRVGSMTIDEVVMLLDHFAGGGALGARARMAHTRLGTPTNASCIVYHGILELLLNLEVFVIVCPYRSAPIRLLYQYYVICALLVNEETATNARNRILLPGTPVHVLHTCVRTIMHQCVSTGDGLDRIERLAFVTSLM